MLFDQVSSEYDEWLKEPLGQHTYQQEVDLMKSLLTLTDGMKVLDVGCWTGNFSLELAEMGCDLVGIDTSAGMLAVAEEKLKGYEGVAFKQIDVHQLDFPDESFDVVVAMTSFEFMQNQDQALSEMWRVLKEGGQLIIGTINAKGQWAELYLSDAFRDDRFIPRLTLLV